MGIKQDFKVYCSTNLTKTLLETTYGEEDDLILEGIVSTTSVDEDGDYMTKSCLEDMKRQLIGLSILKEHGRKLDDILGRIIGILDSTSDTVKVKYKILPRYKYYLKEFLDNDINLGLSIGAKAVDYEPRDESEYGWKINKVKLYEVSLVPLPSNWDSFGSVKVSKELEDNTIVAKCFNGACKLLAKEYSENINKEIEDAQKGEEDEYITTEEAINLMNELGIGIYERVLSEVLDEAKNMIEKYHLNNNHTNNDENSEKKENSNDKKVDDNSSKSKEDEEKEKSMSAEEVKEIKAKETPDVQENLEELEGTSHGDEGEKMEKELKTEEPTVDVNVSVDEVSNADVLKSIEDMKTDLKKGFSDKFDSIDAKIDEIIDKKLEAMRDTIRKDAEEELFKELTTERKPVETEQPKVETEEEVEEEEEVNKAMSAHDIAKMLCS